MSNIRLLERELLLAAPLDVVFPFFATPENLERITPPFVGFEILTPRPLTMRVGLRIDYKIRLHGFPLRWTSEITEYEPQHRFVDVQIKGPYRFWEHEHRFVAEGNSTRVIDRVRYAVLGGAIIDRLFVRPDLERIFDYRSSAIERVLLNRDAPGSVQTPAPPLSQLASNR
jgi:ligand-binding SRPBCC domain-containing protein